ECVGGEVRPGASGRCSGTSCFVEPSATTNLYVPSSRVVTVLPPFVTVSLSIADSVTLIVAATLAFTTGGTAIDVEDDGVEETTGGTGIGVTTGAGAGAGAGSGCAFPTANVAGNL